MFAGYFAAGHSPISALELHKMKLQTEYAEDYYKVAADGSRLVFDRKNRIQYVEEILWENPVTQSKHENSEVFVLVPIIPSFILFDLSKHMAVGQPRLQEKTMYCVTGFCVPQKFLSHLALKLGLISTRLRRPILKNK